MNNCAHLWQYVAELFLEWERVQTKVVEKIKTRILFDILTFRRPCIMIYSYNKTNEMH